MKRLGSVLAGMRVAVKLSGSKTVKGVVESVTADSTTLQRKGVLDSSPAANVRQPRVHKRYNERSLGWSVTVVVGTLTLAVPNRVFNAQQCGGLRELGHWTGHPDRMNRGTLAEASAAGHGSREHARDELRAEIASMMVGDHLELGHDRSPPLAERWIEILREDPLEIDRASREAQRICDCLLALDRGRPAQWQAASRADQAVRVPPRPGREGPSR